MKASAFAPRTLLSLIAACSAVLVADASVHAQYKRLRVIYTHKDGRFQMTSELKWFITGPDHRLLPANQLTLKATTPGSLTFQHNKNTYQVFDTCVKKNGTYQWPGTWAPRYAPPVAPGSISPEGWWQLNKLNLYIAKTKHGITSHIEGSKYIFPYRRLGPNSYIGTEANSTIEFVGADLSVWTSGDKTTVVPRSKKTGRPQGGTLVHSMPDIAGLWVTDKSEVMLLVEDSPRLTAYHLPSPFPNKQTKRDKRLFTAGTGYLPNSYTTFLTVDGAQRTGKLSQNNTVLTFPKLGVWRKNISNATYRVVNRKSTPLAVYYRVQQPKDPNIYNELFFRYVLGGETLAVKTHLGEKWGVRDAYSGKVLTTVNISKKDDSFVVGP